MRTRVLVVAAMMGCMLGLAQQPASAHAGRPLGSYFMVIGWGDEPAYTGFKNSVQVILSDHDEKPVVDVGDTLSVEVTFGTEKKTLKLEPHFRVGAFGTPGDYRAWLTPTSAGDYTFRVFGTIKGQRVNASVKSGENTFNGVDDQADVQFPQPIPNGAELSTRLDREIPRVQTTLAASIKETDNSASQARLLGIIGVALGALGAVLGALGAVLGGVSLLRKR